MSAGPTKADSGRRAPDLSDVAIVLGFLLVVAGAWWAYPPAAVIVLGGALILTGVRAG